ncbi:hypothetical protein [Mucilaginibacter terrae]|uniref:Uncharacterized protein n=1 Tax=Mucilaginibacter terrae TaxID=1955052 RepID=A0ABU3GN91_9SPHI|nr:hypothetical protein [Mucilaginibacter terrae]MDT3401252.1 hypothetical protein [Mucilaginibacter terrae]
MEAILNKNNFSSGPPLREVMAMFFRRHSPDSAKFVFWKVFQCWALKDCSAKARISDQELALFFDQLNDLLNAAYVEHQANNLDQKATEDSGNES